jgi:RimJ/RimL family protein N-acetyltransferase
MSPSAAWKSLVKGDEEAAVIQLSADAFATCPPLAEVPIFTGFARAVLEGVSGGRVWCQDGAVHALHDYGMSLIWGEGVGRAFPALIDHLNTGAYRYGPELLQVDPRWGDLDWDGQLRAERFHRVNFRFDRHVFEKRHLAPALPPGWTLQPLVETAYDLPDVHVTPRAFWKNFAAFQNHGGGMMAVKDGEVGAMAFSATRFDDWLEIGIETRAAFRGQGLARAVAVAMIRKGLESGITPVWACRQENTGSLHLAQSLGFVITKVVPFYRLAG